MEQVIPRKVLAQLLRGFTHSIPAGRGNADSVGNPGGVIGLSDHIPDGYSQPSDMAIIKRATDAGLTWDPVGGKMRPKTTQEVGLEPPDKDPVGNVLYGNKFRDVSNPPSLGHTVGGYIGKIQRHPIAQSIGKGLFGHGALLGGLTGAGAGYGVGKLYNKFTNSDSSLMPIILSLLGGVAGGAVGQKVAAMPSMSPAAKSVLGHLGGGIGLAGVLDGISNHANYDRASWTPKRAINFGVNGVIGAVGGRQALKGNPEGMMGATLLATGKDAYMKHAEIKDMIKSIAQETESIAQETESKRREIQKLYSDMNTEASPKATAEQPPSLHASGQWLSDHGTEVGGAAGAVGGYGVGKLYNKLTNSDSRMRPIILALLGGAAGGVAGHKLASWKSPDSFGKSGVIDQIIAVISDSASNAQQQRVRARLASMSSTEIGAILSAVQTLLPAAATAAVLKILGVSNMGAMMGAIALGALTYSPDKNTAGTRVVRYNL